MDVLKRPGHLQRDPKLTFQIAGLAVLDRIAQVLANQELHHDERPSLLFAVIVNLDDVIVLNVAGHLRFQQEARFCLDIGAALRR